MLRKAGLESEIVNSPEETNPENHLIIPGVGAFDQGMHQITTQGWEPVIQRAFKNGNKILGICLGAQLLCKKSEEGTVNGIGLIDAEVKDFRKHTTEVKVPHMGWNCIETTQNGHYLVSGLEFAEFYFVHSFFMHCNRDQDILATCKHGIEFTAVAGNPQVCAAQFHPEKSLKNGTLFLQNFFRD